MCGYSYPFLLPFPSFFTPDFFYRTFLLHLTRSFLLSSTGQDSAPKAKEEGESGEVPEWKKKLAEKKKTGGEGEEASVGDDGEKKEPAWKRELREKEEKEKRVRFLSFFLSLSLSFSLFNFLFFSLSPSLFSPFFFQYSLLSKRGERMARMM